MPKNAENNINSEINTKKIFSFVDRAAVNIDFNDVSAALAE
jgi:hypothetical protein